MKKAVVIKWKYWDKSASEFTATYASPEEFESRNISATAVKWFVTLQEAQEYAAKLNVAKKILSALREFLGNALYKELCQQDVRQCPRRKTARLDQARKTKDGRKGNEPVL